MSVLVSRGIWLAPRSVVAFVASGAAAASSGCTGEISQMDVADNGAESPATPSSPSSPSGGDDTTRPGSVASACTTRAVGPSLLRRLTPLEYDNTVRDLLGDTTHPSHGFPSDLQDCIFNNAAGSQTVPVLLAERYFEAADQLASGAVRDLPALMGCDPTRGEAACARAFIERFGRRAFRRPLSADEVTRTLAVFQSVRTASDVATGARAVVGAMLVSPSFLFRAEFGEGTSAVSGALALTPFEQASRLSYLLWSSMPDDALLDAAATGQLRTPAQVAAQARRMLMDDKAKPAVAAVFRQWLGLQDLGTVEK